MPTRGVRLKITAPREEGQPDVKRDTEGGKRVWLD